MRPEPPHETLVRLGLDAAAAAELITGLSAIPVDTPPAGIWLEVSRSLLTRDIPFDIHRLLYELTFADWDPAAGPPPVWIPSLAEITRSNIAALCKKADVAEIRALHRWSADHRETFWKMMIDTLSIQFKKHPQSIMDTSDGAEVPQWLPGARLNIADSCFIADPDRAAIVYQTQGGAALKTLSYGDLDRLSNRVAASLAARGFRPRDPVAIAMPMTVEAVAAYLGIVKAGCTVVSIADSFAPDEIAKRIRIAEVKTVITQDVVLRGAKILPMYEKITAVFQKNGTVIVVPAKGPLAVSLREQDIGWARFLADVDRFDTVDCDPQDTTNVLFSSGTTGDPKAIPWTHTTPIKCAMDGHLHHDIHPGDVIAWPTNIGWMMGPWLIYASLVNRATMALYYGSPVTHEFCRFVQNAHVTMLGVVPSLVKNWQNTHALDGLDWSSIKAFSSTGESSNPDDYLYLMSLAGYRPIIEYCGGTEIGGGYISGTIVQPASPSTFSTPAFGLDFCILDTHGAETPTGELFIIPPSIGLSNTLLNGDHHQVYFHNTPPGPDGELLRRHGDEFEALPGGYYRAHGRADDTMNLGGIKISSKEIERTLDLLDGVTETAAVSYDPPGGGPSRLVIYAVADTGTEPEPGVLRRAMQRAVASSLNPLFKIHDVVIVDQLPRTASNKVMRRVLRDRYAKK